MKKILQAFIVLFVFILCSCPLENEFEAIYPSDLSIPNGGILKYIGTSWDQSNKFNQKGIVFRDVVLIDNVIWIYTNQKLYKGINNPASVTIDYGLSYAVRIWKITSKGEYVTFIAERSKDEYPYYTSEWYLVRVHRSKMVREYIKIPPEMIDGKRLVQSYSGNDNLLFFRVNIADSSSYNCYTINNNCDGVIGITEQEFNSLYSPKPDYETDGNGRRYRINNEKFEVSIDNGTTWYQNDMGTNVPKKVIIQNDSVYVFCDQAYESISVFHSEYFGGGIHEFRWQ